VSLHSGKQLWFDRSGHISPVQPADLQAAEGWTEGKLFVHDWKLPDLLAEGLTPHTQEMIWLTYAELLEENITEPRVEVLSGMYQDVITQPIQLLDYQA